MPINDEITKEVRIDYVEVDVDLEGEDGNAFAIMGRVSRALKNAGQREQADAFVKEAMSQTSYDNLIQLCFKYVDAE